ncbi:MAG: transglutaminase domain-containing protein [Anaerolineales bacterium]|nr:transglutaminase domain-containing protein [Anaerolineales bacterium]
MQTPNVRRFDWLSILLLLLMIQTASARLVITRWTDYLIFSQTLAMLGIILGLALGYSQFKRGTVGWLVLGYSIVLIPWQMTLAIEGDVLLSERLASIGGRLLFSLEQFFRREIVTDGLLFVAAISTLVWFLSIVSGYWWTRYNNYLVAVLPGGIFTLIIHLYDWLYAARAWVLGAYILWALFLLGRLHYLRNRELWRSKRVFQMQESEFDITRGMMILATIFVFVAWTVPASAAGWQSAREYWYRITKPWRDVQEWFSNAVEVLESPIGWEGGDFFTSQLALGAGNPLNDTVLFSVEAPNLPEKPPRFYWRGYTYATYTNHQWYALSSRSDEFSPTYEEILIPNLEDRYKARFKVTTQIKQFLLYTPTQPTWVSRPGEFRYAPTDNDAVDIAAWYVEPALLPGEQFQIEAALADPSIQRLQAAGEDYPEWIKERYLQLPEDSSPRIQALAEEITTNLETPYDKTAAITLYLRREIEYANPLPEPPPNNVDPLEWILFDLKQGFCNYYASVEVVMLRSIGIPARMAVGFAEGSFDSEDNLYYVRNLDTHAWPEVYFPGIGWVEFEPTGNQQPLIRPNRPEESPQREDDIPGGNLIDPGALNPIRELDEDPNLPEDIFIPEAAPVTNYRYLYISVTVLLLALLWLIDRKYAVIDNIPVRLQKAYERNDGRAPAWIKNWARWTSLSPIERSFETINRSLRLLDAPPAIRATPSERADTLTQKLPRAASAIATLTEQHLASLFTPQPGDANRAQRASFAIWLYTLQTIIQNFMKRLDERFSRPGQFQ